jgi:hypothetical protein
MMTQVVLQFSRCAPLTWRERWQQKAWVDYSLWICRLTHSPFSHVDMVLEDGNLLGASDNPYAPVVAGNARGVAIRPPDYQRFAVRRNVTITTSNRRATRFYDYVMSQRGKPFDNSALKPGVFLSGDFSNRDWRTEDCWYCAELIGRAVEVAPLLDWTIPGIKNRITPADLILLLAPLYDYDRSKERLPIAKEHEQ